MKYLRATLLTSIFLMPFLHAQSTFDATGLVTPRFAASQILLPAAGATPGGNGTFFRSDVSIVNFREQAQRIVVQWLPQGTTGTAAQSREVTIPAQSGISSEDFVTSFLGQQGLGAILVSALNATGTVDNGALLHATARVWTNQPGSTGTVSQTFPTVPTSSLSTTRATILGQRRDTRYRLNVGIVNLGPTSQTYRIVVSGSTPTLIAETVDVTVPSFSMVQTSLNGAAHAEFLQVDVVATSGGSSWLTYGSSVDNTTGDSWSSLGFSAP